MPAFTHTDVITSDDEYAKGDDSSFEPPVPHWLVDGDRSPDVASGAEIVEEGASEPALQDCNTNASASAEETSNTTRG